MVWALLLESTSVPAPAFVSVPFEIAAEIVRSSAARPSFTVNVRLPLPSERPPAITARPEPDALNVVLPPRASRPDPESSVVT